MPSRLLVASFRTTYTSIYFLFLFPSTMTTLPSFVELMESLGLDQTTKTPDQASPSTNSSPSSSPRLASATAPLHGRSKSSQSLRDANATRQRIARYSPYSPILVCDFLYQSNHLFTCGFSLLQDVEAFRLFLQHLLNLMGLHCASVLISFFPLKSFLNVPLALFCFPAFPIIPSFVQTVHE